MFRKAKIMTEIKRRSSFQVPSANLNVRPKSDEVIDKISDYVVNKKITSTLAMDTARLCFLDTIGCGLAALQHEQARKIIQPIVPGTVVPNGTKVLGTNLVMDPVDGAFAVGSLIRWLDFNDCWLAAEWGHPSDNLGGILPVADYLTRLSRATGGKEGKIFTVKDILENMVKAHEIQGILALDNSFNKVGLDHVVLVKVATTAVVSRLLGLSKEQINTAVSHAFVDGQSLRTYRHAPNTGSRKSWAAGYAVARAVHLSYLTKNAHIGEIPSVLTAKRWGFYDVLFNGKPFSFKQRSEFDSYVMENILFKISFPAEFHAQTAVEAAIEANKVLKNMNKSYKDIKSVIIKTQKAALEIIDKKGDLYNYADRDHCIQYMIAFPLIYGRLTATDYSDENASNTEINVLRNKMTCEEETTFTTDYYDPKKRSIGNSLVIELEDGTVLDEIRVEYPIGHKFRREEGIPLIWEKFQRHVKEHYGENNEQVEQILSVTKTSDFVDLEIDKFVDMLAQK
ncbi:hypothetical protein TPHA_0P00490 [Tetrapisispora phaffii CBS 4417]|uniref:2-methylcitrate dehydratase n=1 Tax=Tetrapisispora phaffii (strain ATCC 24235 / CBS 4417 / NBRC 1672 / NRRL Y-8282 / UCD 70-5) TaxID=1071381 RepID=G8C229_TETPH|nr:hypothetical protein TPHA_0P00490 [Tetrapisispora phaffii CBS 4417]CCE66207.1 hypothetical protein TPHA_0P00490 [Tetrapisispora phaffii CBS 4417]